MYIGRKQIELKYIKALKIMYGIILFFFVLIFVVLIEKVWNGGGHGELAALVIGEIFVIYGGVLLNRLWKSESNGGNLTDEEDMAEIIDELSNEKQWSETYNSISDSKRRISYVRHDIANHVQVLQSIQEQTNIKLERLGAVEEELERLSTVKYCDNVLLDMALEQRIRAMRKRGLQVKTDMQLNGMKQVRSEQACLIFWLLIDGIADNVSEGRAISIKIYKHSSTDSGVMLAWNIVGECDRINKENVKLLEFLLSRMNGSVMVDVEDGKVIETGMMEVSDTDGR